jgi:CBS domain-containing protein
MHVDERMTKNLSTCRPEDTLAVAARQMWDSDCGCLPVVDEHGHLRGMVTDRDVCMAAMTTGRPLSELRVALAMAVDVATAMAADSLHDAELTMRRRGVRRLPVVDDQHRVIGVLSCNDLVRCVDDGSGHGPSERDAAHLVRTLANIGRSRRAQATEPSPRPLAVATAASRPHGARPHSVTLVGSMDAVRPAIATVAAPGLAP